MGWLIFAGVAVVAAVLFALAWWSSGRTRPLAGERQLGQAEKDYLAGQSQRQAGQSMGGGGGIGGQ
jgi:hypothetical protein